MSDGGTGTGGAPAGWYQDGQTAGQERWWDGTRWTDHFRPIGGMPPMPLMAPPQTGMPPRGGSFWQRLSMGGRIGIIAGAVVVVAGIVIGIVALAGGFAGGGVGNYTSAEKSEYLRDIKTAAPKTRLTDTQLLTAGTKVCEIMGSVSTQAAYLSALARIATEVPSAMGLSLTDATEMTAYTAIGRYSMTDLCPEVATRLSKLSN